MTKTRRNNSIDLKKAMPLASFAIAKIRNRKRKKILQSIHEHGLGAAVLGDDIIISPSGQSKIDSLASCLSLKKSDFIVFSNVSGFEHKNTI